MKGYTRLNYDLARASVPTDIVLTASELRSSIQTNATDTQIRFPLLTNDVEGAPPVSSKFLNQADSFLITAIGFFMSADSDTLPDDQFSQLFTNPLITIIGGGAVDYPFYNGKFDLSIDNYKYLDSIAVYNSWYNCETAENGGTVDGWCQDLEQGFFELQPLIKITGRSKIEAVVSMPSVATALTKVSWCLRLRGYLAQGSQPYA